MLKEILCSRFPTMEIEEEPDGRELFNKIDSSHQDWDLQNGR
jgi:hypothetical protein